MQRSNKIVFALNVLPVFLFAQNPPPDVMYIPGSSVKLDQIIGDWEFEWQVPTVNQTNTNYGMTRTDLGVPFRHNGITYLLFGDSQGTWPGDLDATAYTYDTNPDDGLALSFLTDINGNWNPITIPGVALGTFEVPTEVVSWGGNIYLYATTNTMAKSVVAVSTDDGYTYTKLYDWSTNHFINVSIIEVNLNAVPGFPSSSGQGMAIFGSGTYRASDVYLAYQHMNNIGTASGIQYFAGLDMNGNPTWTSAESGATPLFNQPCVGELSVSYNAFIKKWIMTYNCDQNPSVGVNCRFADKPWGPWSQEQVIFNDWVDGGYCNFIHVDWNYQNCDNAFDAGREYQWGGDYGPYQFSEFAKSADNTRTTIYYTMSTWNPYTVVLMRTELELLPKNLQVLQDTCPHNGLTFSWENTGNNWFLDISEDPNFANWYYKNVSNLTSTTGPDNFVNVSNATDYLILQPQRTYYWRIWNGYRHSTVGSFTTSLCTYANTNCTGNFYDTGGPSATYGGNEDYTTVFSPPGATSVSMTFSSFDTEAGYDSLWIYNGLPNTNLIGMYTGNVSPGTVTANTGTLSVRFKADPLVHNNGWSANWTCVTGGMSINETEKAKLYVYPTAGDGIFYVNSGGLEIKKIQVYDLYAKLVYETNEAKFNLSTLPAGCYLVVTEAGERIFRNRIILSK